MLRKLVSTDTAGVRSIRHGPVESPEFARWNEQVLLRPQGIYGLQNLDVGILKHLKCQPTMFGVETPVY